MADKWLVYEVKRMLSSGIGSLMFLLGRAVEELTFQGQLTAFCVPGQCRLSVYFIYIKLNEEPNSDLVALYVTDFTCSEKQITSP